MTWPVLVAIIQPLSENNAPYINYRTKLYNGSSSESEFA